MRLQPYRVQAGLDIDIQPRIEPRRSSWTAAASPSTVAATSLPPAVGAYGRPARRPCPRRSRAVSVDPEITVEPRPWPRSRLRLSRLLRAHRRQLPNDESRSQQARPFRRGRGIAQLHPGRGAPAHDSAGVELVDPPPGAGARGSAVRAQHPPRHPHGRRAPPLARGPAAPGELTGDVGQRPPDRSWRAGARAGGAYAAGSARAARRVHHRLAREQPDQRHRHHAALDRRPRAGRGRRRAGRRALSRDRARARAGGHHPGPAPAAGRHGRPPSFRHPTKPRSRRPRGGAHPRIRPGRPAPRSSTTSSSWASAAGRVRADAGADAGSGIAADRGRGRHLGRGARRRARGPAARGSGARA